MLMRRKSKIKFSKKENGKLHNNEKKIAPSTQDNTYTCIYLIMEREREKENNQITVDGSLSYGGAGDVGNR